MSTGLKEEYLRILKKRYLGAKKWLKSMIIDELCQNIGCHRKHAIRLLNGNKKFKSKRGRRPRYSKDCLPHLKQLFRSMNFICAKKMKAAMPFWIIHYDHPELTKDIKDQLLEMSASTIERMLKGHKAKLRRSLNNGTTPATYFKNRIPIRPYDYNIKTPGHFEADTVAHCGNSMRGSFVWSLTFTDIYTGWTENRATWNKGAEGVKNAIFDIEKGLPFRVLSFHSDNGTEFLNYHLESYLKDLRRSVKVNWTRSRAGRKNDACYAEQKNWSHVRETFGYERYGKEEFVSMMNDIYKNEQYLLYNFFIPTMKLKYKHRVGSKYRRSYFEPVTPYQRLMDSDALSEKQKEELAQFYKSLNPFKIKKSLSRKLNAITKLLLMDNPSIRGQKKAS